VPTQDPRTRHPCRSTVTLVGAAAKPVILVAASHIGSTCRTSSGGRALFLGLPWVAFGRSPHADGTQLAYRHGDDRVWPDRPRSMPWRLVLGGRRGSGGLQSGWWAQYVLLTVLQYGPPASGRDLPGSHGSAMVRNGLTSRQRPGLEPASPGHPPSSVTSSAPAVSGRVGVRRSVRLSEVIRSSALPLRIRVSGVFGSLREGYRSASYGA